jgi:hypothetical protein
MNNTSKVIFKEKYFKNLKEKQQHNINRKGDFYLWTMYAYGFN